MLRSLEKLNSKINKRIILETSVRYEVFYPVLSRKFTIIQVVTVYIKSTVKTFGFSNKFQIVF